MVALMSCGGTDADAKPETKEDKQSTPAVDAESIIEVETVTEELDSTTKELKSGVKEMNETLDTLLTL